MPSDIYDVIVIGGGASGIMAAIHAARNGKRVVIIEHNAQLGAKLKITGGGRCNILNCEYDTRRLLANYGESKDLLYTPFSIFGVKETIEFFESLGIYIKVEDRGRAFPVSESAIDVFRALESELQHLSVSQKLSHKALSFVISESSAISGIRIKNMTKNEEYIMHASQYILSTGGQSHPETGSTGDGFRMLSELGIKVNKPTTGLTPLRSNTEWVNKLSGKALKNIKMTISVDGKSRASFKSKSGKSRDGSKDVNILCTHFGLSGPSIINNAKLVREFLTEGEVVIAVDLFKDMDHKELNQLILTTFDNNKNKKIKNVLNDIYPDNILATIINCHSDKFTQNILESEINSTSREDRWALVHLLKDLKVSIAGLMDDSMSIVTDGGVPLHDIHMNSMRSKQYNNLYITGDLLDISRPSGGYSLQLCWTTGYIAGKLL